MARSIVYSYRYNDPDFRVVRYEDRGYIGCVDTTKMYKISPECPDIRYLLEADDEEDFNFRGLRRVQRPWGCKKKSS